MPITPAFWQAWQRGHRNLPAPNPATTASPATVTFPTTQLVTRVQIALGADLTQPSTTWQWADITNYVRQDLGISWSTGRPDGSGQVGYGRATLKLDNRDGRFSRRNPNSPYFGLLTRNTPIWVTVDAGSGVRDRIQMFVNEWPTRWSDMSATDSTVTIQCSGALRRLGQGRATKSAQRRGLPATNPAAYWPIEDGATSTQAASGISGGTPMTASGVIKFGSATGAPGSGPVADLSTGGQLTGTVPASTATSYRVEFNFIMPVLQPAGFVAMVQWLTPGGGTYLWEVDADETGLYVQYLTPAGASALFASNVRVDNNTWHHVRVDMSQNGANTSVIVTLDGTVVITSLASAPSYAVITRIQVNPTAGANESLPSIGHLVVWTPWASTANTYQVFTGYAGELATTRIRRIAAEENIPMVCTSGVSVAMGPQSAGTAIDVFRECEDVDQGVLYETAWGLGFQALNDRTNMPVGLALDFNQSHIAGLPEPADDDQRLRNRWTVSRTSGSSYVKELTTGQTGTTLAGVYDAPDTVNVQTDTQLGDQAGWRLNIGTVDEDRWPTIPLNFTRSTGLIDTWTTLPFGQRVTVSNPPAQMPPDQLDLVIEGFSELWNPFNWTATINASPFSPYRVGVLAADTGDTSEFLLILVPDTLTLAADVNTTDVTWSINSSPVWTTAAESFPRNVMWEGELITVTNCTGASSPQTWTVTRSVNGVTKAHTAGSTGRIYRPGVLAPA